MTKLELRLDRLECFVQGDASGGSEPYLWPMLIWVTDVTLGTPALLRSNHPHTPRTVLGQNVTAGTALAIPPAAGTTGVQLAEGEVLRSAMAVVGLLENDETPEHVVVAAYESYVRELPAAIARHLLELSSDDDTTVEDAKAAVRDEVSAAVKSAGSNEMTSWEKFKVGIGSLNLDDQVGSAFDDTTSTKALALDFVETSGSGSSAHTTQDWHLTGTLTVDTRVDRCAGLVLAANQAKVRRDQLRDQLRDLRTAWDRPGAPSERRWPSTSRSSSRRPRRPRPSSWPRRRPWPGAAPAAVAHRSAASATSSSSRVTTCTRSEQSRGHDTLTIGAVGQRVVTSRPADGRPGERVRGGGPARGRSACPPPPRAAEA